MRPSRLLLFLLPLRWPPAATRIPAAEPVRLVRTSIAQPQQVGAEPRLPGELRPRAEVVHAFRIGGKIAQRLVSVGDRVDAGQPLARLDSSDTAPALAGAQAALSAARTDARLAQAELGRQQELHGRGYLSQAGLERFLAGRDSAQARVDAAQAQLRQAQNAVYYELLRASAAGFVASVDAEAGQVVAAGQPVLRIARAGEIEARVDVPERDLAIARGAARWQVRIPAAGDRVLSARVRELSPVADPASRTYPMRLALEGDTSGLALGMSAVAASVREGEGRVFVLPVSALSTLDGQPRVWLVDPASSTVRQVPVTTAGLDGDTVRIIEGLAPGDRVVVAGANLLVAGQKVRLPDARSAQ
jgi:RND family efflux transporter MFP subunit